MVMNKELQKTVIQKKFENADMPDRDLESLIDSTLSLPENIANLQRQGKLPKQEALNSTIVKERATQALIYQALEVLEQKHNYSKKQAEVDSSITAEKTFKPPLTEEEFTQWMEDPQSYDIEGVDTAGDALDMELQFSL